MPANAPHGSCGAKNDNRAACGKQPKNMETEQMAKQLCNSTKTHEEWLSVMRFGLNTLLGDQLVLIDCIFTEAQREYDRKDKPRNTQDMQTIAWEIFEELELKITNGEDA